MRRLILHFGTHKTGSTSIQKTLARANLGPDWEYANLGAPNHSRVIQSAFMKGICRVRAYELDNVSEQDSLLRKAKHRTLFESSLKDCKKKNLILSAEGICCLTQDELFDLNATCLAQGFQTEAVGYLREPKSSIESRFYQKYRSLHFPKLTELHSAYPSYSDSLTKFEEVFGEENVSYWRYGSDTLFDKCVVKDFLFRLGINPHKLTIERANESTSLRAFRFLYAYRQLGPAPTPGALALQYNRRLIKELSHLKGPKSSYSKELIDPILKSNQDDIQWANSKLDSPFPTPGFTDGLPGCVKNESDLFDFDPEAICWLARSINKSHTDYSGDPNQIAAWVHDLHQRLVCPEAKSRRPTVIGRIKSLFSKAAMF